jgi:hypothetical protein
MNAATPLGARGRSAISSDPGGSAPAPTYTNTNATTFSTNTNATTFSPNTNATTFSPNTNATTFSHMAYYDAVVSRTNAVKDWECS